MSWIAGHTTDGVSITTAIPLVFDAYATTHQTDDVTAAAYEQVLIEGLTTHTADPLPVRAATTTTGQAAADPLRARPPWWLSWVGWWTDRVR
ncbi:hypothetical protein [Micromonospora sp. NPDC049102]|uniref:hypothetical protein n=1 Tax=Micromonospora sp. NPDC049102 TaxID=3364265 RepID=UPI003718A61A